MAFSTQRVESDGTLVQIGVSLEYFDRSEISVLIDGILSPPGPDAPWHWVGETEKTIEFDEPVAEGVEIMLRRSTNMDAVRHSFEGGAQFKNRTMDENFTQALRIAQEAKEGGTLSDIFVDLNMHGFQIKNIGAPTSDNDAVSLGYYKTDPLGAAVARAGAEAARDAAIAARNAAQSAQSAAATSATNAAGSATASAASATAAATSATNANTSRTQAQTAATNAGNSATSAATSAALAEGYAEAAEDAASSIDAEGLKWSSKFIGEVVYLWDHLPGAEVPPTDNPNFRYIKLVDDDPYNDGCLGTSTTTGTAPNATITATITLADSPMLGGVVELVGSSRKFMRPGSSGVSESSRNKEHTHTATQVPHSHTATQVPHSHTQRWGGGSGGGGNGTQQITNIAVPNQGNTGTTTTAAQPAITVQSATPAITVNPSGDDDARPNSIGVSVYLRIR